MDYRENARKEVEIVSDKLVLLSTVFMKTNIFPAVSTNERFMRQASEVVHVTNRPDCKSGAFDF